MRVVIYMEAWRYFNYQRTAIYVLIVFCLSESCLSGNLLEIGDSILLGTSSLDSLRIDRTE